MAHPVYKDCLLKHWEQIMMQKQAKKVYRSDKAAEVDFKRRDRQRAVDTADDKRLFQEAGVRKSDLLKEKIRKDNEAMDVSKREKERKADQQRREKEEERRQKLIDEQRKEEKETCQRRRDRLAVKDKQVKQTKEKKLLREKERQQEKEEREKLRALDEQHQQELRHEQRKELEAKDKNGKGPDYNYSCQDTDEPLPKLAPRPTLLTRRYRERDSLQQAVVDVRLHFLPQLSRTGDAHHGSKDAGEPLPTKVNSGWQGTPSMEEKIKQYREMDKFQIKESSTADEQPSCFDRLSEEQNKLEVYLKRQNNIKHKEVLISDAAVKKALLQYEIREEIRAARKMPDYNYSCRETDEPLPKRAPQPTLLMRRYQERDSLQQAMVDVRTHFLPPLSRAGDAHHGSKDAGEPLPTKVHSGKDTFQIKESSTADQQPTPLPTIKTPEAPAGRRSPRIGVESSKNRGKETGERLPILDTPKTRETKLENLKENQQRTLLPTIYKKKSEKNLQRVPPITTKNTPAVKIHFPRSVLRAQMTVTGEPLHRLSTEQTQMVKRKQLLLPNWPIYNPQLSNPLL
ncbi:hypothetical protein KUCAC02_007677 [Chaenocephalus aceratus]|uniref:Uncharacterized protein n=1 Tax=Chaenocephalus aceratus TaxID=36190 RepID=A0ACB9X7V2_CHAAC|nr:hypothetical protein KUCAC02_007677 [Chaenocephalus aceratus]